MEESVPRFFTSQGRPLLSELARRHAAGCLALLATLAIHGLLILFWQVELSNVAQHPRDPMGGPHTHRSSETQDTVLTELFVVSLPESEWSVTADPLPAPELTQLHVAVDSLEAQPLRAAEDDDTQNSAMYGKYVEQVQSRIEQAWLRPRTRIGDARFQCRARIEQDRSGNIQEVMLEDCNGTSAWQYSLVLAIQSASPLPTAPANLPKPDAFTLVFQAFDYEPGGSADGFEPAPVRSHAVIASAPATFWRPAHGRPP